MYFDHVSPPPSSQTLSTALHTPKYVFPLFWNKQQTKLQEIKRKKIPGSPQNTSKTSRETNNNKQKTSKQTNKQKVKLKQQKQKAHKNTTEFVLLPNYSWPCGLPLSEADVSTGTPLEKTLPAGIPCR